MMRIACHQPNFLPHMGFFRKLYLSDVFVILDDVQFSRRSYTQRTLIKIQNVGKWLTVPAQKKGKYLQKVCEVQIDNTRNWRKDHIRTFKIHYRRSEYFDEVTPILEELYSKDWQFLINFNIEGIKRIMDFLKINREIVFSSSIGVEGKGSRRIINIVKALNGDAYISGEGGKNYLQLEEFKRNNIKVEFYSYPGEYPQLGFGFIKGLSIIDAMFNIGKNTRRLIED